MKSTGSQLRICEFRCEDALAGHLEDFIAVVQQNTTGETKVTHFKMEALMAPGLA